MKLSDKKLTEDDVKDILIHNAFEYIEDNKYWSHAYEVEVKVSLSGNTLSHLIDWICKFYAENERHIGQSYGKSKVIHEIKKILEI